MDYSIISHFVLYYLPFGLGAGGLFPRPPPDGFPVVLGPSGGLVAVFAINLVV